MSYQWQRSTDSQVTWTNIAGAISAAYVIASVDLSLNGYWYRARISSGGDSLASSPVQLTVALRQLQSRLDGAAYDDSRPLINVAAGPYWTSTPYGSTGAFAFYFKTGTQQAYVTSTPDDPDGS